LGTEEVYTGFWWENTSEREHLEDPGVDANIILIYLLLTAIGLSPGGSTRWIFRKWDGGVDRIDLAQDRDRWLVLGSAVMNLWFPQNSENVLTS
jgi:hypothetical protein